MSGIVGLWNLDGRPASAEEIVSMSDGILHRGPDGRKRMVDGAVALAYLHLETRNKPSPLLQPFVDHGAGLTIVFDGRIDNRQDLQCVLQAHGYAFHTGSDVELTLRAFQLWATEAPARLLGDFAFAIWDSRNQIFFCARDQLGVKPFIYYYLQNSLFAFGSEIQGIIASNRVPRRLNEFRLADYLEYEIDREDTVGTFYQGIQRLPGGHCLLAKRDSVRTWNYWKLDPKEGDRYRSVQDCAEAFRSLLFTAVSDRIRETPDVAYALSGGLDSSSIVAVARELSGGPERASLSTFSVVDPADQAPVKMIKSVIDHGGIVPHLLRTDDLTAETFDLPDFIKKSDQPFEVHQCSFDWFVYHAVHSSNCKVFLDGLDGDQINPNFFYLSALLRGGLWPQAMHDASCLSRELDITTGKVFIRYGLFPIFPRLIYALARIKHPLLRPLKLMWTSPDLAHSARVTERIRARRFATARAARDPYQLHALSFNAGLVSFALECSDKVAGLQAVEPRHPFCDRRVVEFLIALPVEMKGYSPMPKTILREAMHGLLADPLLRQNRLLHPGPALHSRILECYAEWLYSSLAFALRRLREYINVELISSYCRLFRANRSAEVSKPLWNVAVLADWIRVRGFGV